MSRIVAVVVMDRKDVGGGVPIFYANSKEEWLQLSFHLEKIMDASAQELAAGTMLIVKHENGA